MAEIDAYAENETMQSLQAFDIEAQRTLKTVRPRQTNAQCENSANGGGHRRYHASTDDMRNG
jgi:hypothetical protein